MTNSESTHYLDCTIGFDYWENQNYVSLYDNYTIQPYINRIYETNFDSGVTKKKSLISLYLKIIKEITVFFLGILLILSSLYMLVNKESVVLSIFSITFFGIGLFMYYFKVTEAIEKIKRYKDS